MYLKLVWQVILVILACSRIRQNQLNTCKLGNNLGKGMRLIRLTSHRCVGRYPVEIFIISDSFIDRISKGQHDGVVVRSMKSVTKPLALNSGFATRCLTSLRLSILICNMGMIPQGFCEAWMR